MKRPFIVCSLLLVAAVAGVVRPCFAQSSDGKPLPTISKKTDGMIKMPGFFTDYWDDTGGKIWLQIDKWNLPFLYYESLANGVGSNDIGLDRGEPGQTQVVHFERSGPHVFLVAENTRYRAVTDDATEREAVREAFPQSILWGFDVAAVEGDAVLVDATGFFLRDAHGVAATLQQAHQGAFRLDASRCAIYLPRTKSFPQNTDVEAVLTFTFSGTGDGAPGNWVGDVAPDPTAITVHEHSSFIEAPPPGFQMREYDPRAGFFGIQYMDFSTPVDQSIHKRFITRWRLEKKDPTAVASEPVKPIVYYVDRAAPEPIRSALVEGAGWWNQAFEAAGYKNAFQVKVLPEGVDPMDVRYNVIEWVPRATRGWSVGDPIIDPRTGEIINGHVRLDALRIRQVFLIAQGLLDPFGSDPSKLREANEMALARIRQLAAHETGHTLGLAHNYAGSIVNRSSVMDYPSPLVTLGKDGVPDVSDSYAVGIGAWDKTAIDFGYREFPSGADEKTALDKILDDAFSKGQLYLTDQDARPAGAASPVAHLWDVGDNPLDGLKQVMAVRAAALKRLSEDAIPENTPLATLEDVLVPAYLYHRYQVSAVTTMIGGLDYSFNVKGGSQQGPEIVPPDKQRSAIRAALDTLQPGALEVPENLLKMIPPRPPEYRASQENFGRRTAPAFDALAPAESAAEIVVGMLLEPNRDERMVEYHARDARYPGFAELVDDLLASTWKATPKAGYDGAIQIRVDSVVLNHQMSLAIDAQTAAGTRAIALQKLDELKNWAAAQLKTATDEQWRAELLLAKLQITELETRPANFHVASPMPPPAGDPIGDDGWQ